MNEAMKALKARAANVMSKEVTFVSEKEAIKEAAKKADALYSLWKAPDEMGGKYTLVQFENREEAGICGYKEVYNVADLKDELSGRGIDEIEEV